MPQIFEKKIHNFCNQAGFHLISATELEKKQLYFAHLEVLEEASGNLGLLLPEGSFLISCYQALGLSTFQTQYCTSEPTQDGDRAGCLKAGQHLMLIGKSSWLTSTLQRFNSVQKQKIKSVGGYLPYCDAQISTLMLIRQGQLLIQERRLEPSKIDLHGFVVVLLGEWEGVQHLLYKVEMGRGKWLVSQTNRLIEQHLEGEPLTLDTIAKTLAVSVSKLKIAFRHEMGISVYRHYLNLRLDRAKTHLSSGKYNVSEVAYRIGYTSVSKFSKMYAEYHGALPSHMIKERASFA
jgi:AraC-like DNA-binding protein